MHAFLNTHELGVGHVARCTVERLMRRMGIRGVSRRRTRHVTASAPRHACPLDLVKSLSIFLCMGVRGRG